MYRLSVESMYGGGWVVSGPDGDYMSVAQNHDAVRVAELFGMRLRHRPRCQDRGYTDGTVDCPSCGQSADTFMAQAFRYLDTCAEWGRTADDPGIFDA